MTLQNFLPPGLGFGNGIGGGPGGASPSTPFQATLQQASFGGVPFIVLEDEGEAGRRGQTHEYPFRDVPYTEDLGRRARRWQFRAYVLGVDCAAQRDALLAALEIKGPQQLVHPSMPPVMVQPDPLRPCRYREVWDQNGKIEFELAFVEPGIDQYPTNDSDTQATSAAAANGIDNSANSDLGDGVDAAGSGSGFNSVTPAPAGGGFTTVQTEIPPGETSQTGGFTSLQSGSGDTQIPAGDTGGGFTTVQTGYDPNTEIPPGDASNGNSTIAAVGAANETGVPVVGGL